MPILLQQWNHDQFSNHILAGGVAGHDSHLTPHIGPLYSLIPSCIPSLILASHSLTPLILFPAPPSPPPPHSPSPPKPSSHSHPLTTPIPLTPSPPPHHLTPPHPQPSSHLLLPSPHPLTPPPSPSPSYPSLLPLPLPLPLPHHLILQVQACSRGGGVTAASTTSCSPLCLAATSPSYPWQPSHWSCTRDTGRPKT